MNPGGVTFMGLNSYQEKFGPIPVIDGVAASRENKGQAVIAKIISVFEVNARMLRCSIYGSEDAVNRIKRLQQAALTLTCQEK
jgi:hypothetical protein